jgi:EAL domain-containing protein (putative c-di-GMP-specific phosphodiesterase class I)
VIRSGCFLFFYSLNASNILEDIVKDIIRASGRIAQLSPVKVGIEMEVGYAFLDSPEDFNTGYLQAQTALFSSEQKNNKYQRYSPKQDTFINEQLELMHNLESAISSENIDIYIQPQFNLINNKLHGGEVLLRWFHPTKGNIPPDKFILLAEKSGLIFTITQLVIKKTCQWLQQLKNNNANIDNIKVSINLSALDLAQDSLLPYLQNTLFEYRIASQQITLEVTESAVMDNPEKFLSSIKKLKGAGFKISIDDFGTGYSSMQYLQTMQAEEIKIDMAFIRDIHINETNQSIVKAIIQLAHSTNAHTVAEGVELKEEAEYLKNLNCQVAQGYHWDPALTLKAFEDKYLHN